MTEGSVTKLTLHKAEVPTISPVLNALLSAAQSNPDGTLRELRLGGLRIDKGKPPHFSLRTEHYDTIAEILKASRSLRLLDLSDQEISDDNARKIFRALHLNSSLEDLRLNSGKMSKCAYQIRDMLKSNASLRRLHLGKQRSRHVGQRNHGGSPDEFRA